MISAPLYMKTSTRSVKTAHLHILILRHFQARILVPSAAAPPSSGSSGLWRRTSSTGAVDAQGLGLTHPMTWIDERLFGWSRSAKRGTSAWGGGGEISQIHTPDDSDDEDTGDYDNVVGLVTSSDDQMGPTQKTRSRQSSYADLQRLRMAPLTAQSRSQNGSAPIQNIPDATSPSQLQHRTRRASLRDDVPVARIGALTPNRPFDEDTERLNEEIEKNK